MPMTCSSRNLARPFREPRLVSGAIWATCRPFRAQSTALSDFVPGNRCDGFTHGGLSHRCSTQSPLGTGPCINSHATRWANLNSPSHVTRPYPSPPARCHSQHSLGDRTSAFAQNSSGVSLFCEHPQLRESPLAKDASATIFSVPQSQRQGSMLCFPPVAWPVTVHRPMRCPMCGIVRLALIILLLEAMDWIR